MKEADKYGLDDDSFRRMRESGKGRSFHEIKSKLLLFQDSNHRNLSGHSRCFMGAHGDSEPSLGQKAEDISNNLKGLSLSYFQKAA